VADHQESNGQRNRPPSRAARHAYWFPLVLFGVLIAASAPFFVEPTPPPGVTTWVTSGNPLPNLGGNFFQPSLSYYWLAAIVTGLGLTGWWYSRRGARVGVRTRSRGFLLTGLVITAALIVVPFPFGILTMRGTFPILIIAVALWMLARAERSAGLSVVAMVFTAAALLAGLYNVEDILPASFAEFLLRYTSVPGVFLPPLVLLVAGGIAFMPQRRAASGARPVAE
jgi:hypothetical protein